MVNRRLFRPGLDMKRIPSPRTSHAITTLTCAQQKASSAGNHPRRKFYWIKQMQSRTPMVVVLESGEASRQGMVRPRLHQAHPPGQPQSHDFQAHH